MAWSSQTVRSPALLFAEAGASYGMRPQDSAGWQAAVARHAAVPAADADGRSWRTSDGRAATLADHFEAQTGVRTRRASRFEPGPDGGQDLAVIEPQRDIPAATRGLSAAIIARHLPYAAPKDAGWERDKARMDPRRQAAVARARAQNPDHRRADAERQRAGRMPQGEPVQLSTPMTAGDGEDVFGPVCGSLGAGLTWGQL